MTTQIDLKAEQTPDLVEPIAEDSNCQVRVIGPSTGWQLLNVRELWLYRELLYFLVWRDVKVRYKQTLLGAAWAILQPAMMMVVFTIFFGRMAHVPAGEMPYPLFVFAGLLPWTFFATAISNAGNSVVGSERLITKIYFPRLAIPFAAVGAAVVDFALAFCLLMVLVGGYVCLGHNYVMPRASFVALPLVLFFLLLAAVGVGTLLAALNVAYRDFRYVIPFMVQLWMFATPTVYMEPTRGESWVHTIIGLNPISGLIAAFRAAALGGTVAWEQLTISGACSLIMFLGGCLYFRKVEDQFADII